ncbi:MAG: hypothetical protein HKN12_04840, partial [Gemmatimonadetes bacterium]|nr:hypothetical protein [Gemmatimonadota bacterium]
DQDEAIRRLGEHRSALLEWVYREFAEECRSRDVKPLWAFLSLPGRTPDPALIDDQVRLAKESGFITWDLRDVYDGHDPETLQIAPWDWHPNPEGHRIIADRLFEELQGSWQLQ